MPERDLPLKDYDHLPVGSLTTRIRSLGVEDLTTLLDYEKAHGNRFQVVRVMESRLSSLRNGAQPSGGDPSGRQRCRRAGRARGRVQGLRGDLRPAGQPAVARRPDQPRPTPQLTVRARGRGP
ncbi:hypothetical protein [Blastococcus sp. TML/M2B]|uniref:hypothetical protein n=1 Tax=Blastococcus sp. TML/M2B TaxID=2798727 RepID=UPI001F5B656F|nr:hypothetical protein [Blastococcus sp. TML/M2B]